MRHLCDVIFSEVSKTITDSEKLDQNTLTIGYRLACGIYQSEDNLKAAIREGEAWKNQDGSITYKSMKHTNSNERADKVHIESDKDLSKDEDMRGAFMDMFDTATAEHWNISSIMSGSASSSQQTEVTQNVLETLDKAIQS